MDDQADLTAKERDAFCQLQRMLNTAKGCEVEHIPVNTTGLSRLVDYGYQLRELQKLFLASVVDRFPNHTAFEFVQNNTDIVAALKDPSV